MQTPKEHIYTKQAQVGSLEEIKNRLLVEDALIKVDFSENYENVQQGKFKAHILVVQASAVSQLAATFAQQNQVISRKNATVTSEASIRPFPNCGNDLHCKGDRSRSTEMFG